MSKLLQMYRSHSETEVRRICMICIGIIRVKPLAPRAPDQPVFFAAVSRVPAVENHKTGGSVWFKGGYRI